MEDVFLEEVDPEVKFLSIFVIIDDSYFLSLCRV